MSDLSNFHLRRLADNVLRTKAEYAKVLATKPDTTLLNETAYDRDLTVAQFNFNQARHALETASTPETILYLVQKVESSDNTASALRREVDKILKEFKEAACAVEEWHTVADDVTAYNLVLKDALRLCGKEIPEE